MSVTADHTADHIADVSSVGHGLGQSSKIRARYLVAVLGDAHPLYPGPRHRRGRRIAGTSASGWDGQ
jgi:hypothetical protein